MAYTIPDYQSLRAKLPHLAPKRVRELQLITQILLEEFAKTQKFKMLWNKNGRVLKIILYGSTARGTRQDDPANDFASDYDIMIVVNEEKYADMEKYWDKAETRLEQARDAGQIIPMAQPVVHSLADINKKLAVGRPFFLDIFQEGIMLYEEAGHEFVKPGRMTKAEQKREAEGYFEEWYADSVAALKGAKFYFKESGGELNSDMKLAAFMAHQATERIYHCLLLTLTLYSPKLHNIRELRRRAENMAPELSSVWPRQKPYKRYFELLRRAYVEARYSKHYEITAEELSWLFARIEDLQARVKEICEAHLRK